MEGDTLNQLEIGTGLIGGLALFLFGLDILTRALKQIAGASLKDVLGRMTGNRVKGLLAGAGITAVIQSSSVTTVLLVGFVSAGLMSTAQSVPVIIGANIGTTITAQVLAFKVTALALPLLSVGFFAGLIAKSRSTREYGRILLGLGMVFFGMSIMGDAMAPLRVHGPVIDFLASLDNVWLAVVIGAGFTALVQSSSATTGILIVIAGQGLMSLESAVAVMLGANIGTCVTALLASIGHPREAVRAALVHTLFNVGGVMIWIWFIPQLAGFATSLSPAGEVNMPRQLANAHTLFNVLNALFFIGFTGPMAALSLRLLPDRAGREEPEFAPHFLNSEFLGVPALSIDALRREIHRLGGLVREMLEAAVPALTSGSPLDVDRVAVMDRPVDLLHREIVRYTREISLRSLPADQSDLLVGLIKIANDLEHAGDLVATSLVTSARKRMEEGIDISPATAGIIAELHREVVDAFDGTMQALDAQDASLAEAVRARKPTFSSMIDRFALHESERLRIGDGKRLQTYTREIELTETLDDLFKIIRRIARTELGLFRAPPEAKPD
ncbi:Na/Pi cotransporter family protein [Marimonas sp. MJW-29]|uniref:Na/Pi cotransporter family protein n=1 Tax=Sulfitobacter sediminis TaxID=3234186 RepID=A0ABV3RPN4_9RHOB